MAQRTWGILFVLLIRYRISASGTVSVFAGTGQRGQKDGAPLAAEFSNPNGIVADATGRLLYINDYIGDPNALGMAITPYSVRQIELPSLPRIVEYQLDNGSVDSMKAVCRDYLGNPDHAGEQTLTGINFLDWKFMGLERFAEAVAIFELNAETNPDSWQTHSSLGGGYTATGQRDEAIAASTRSLELNPDNQVAKGRLIKLGVMEE